MRDKKGLDGLYEVIGCLGERLGQGSFSAKENPDRCQWVKLFQ